MLFFTSFKEKTNHNISSTLVINNLLSPSASFFEKLPREFLSSQNKKFQLGTFENLIMKISLLKATQMNEKILHKFNIKRKFWAIDKTFDIGRDEILIKMKKPTSEPKMIHKMRNKMRKKTQLNELKRKYFSLIFLVRKTKENICTKIRQKKSCFKIKIRRLYWKAQRYINLWENISQEIPHKMKIIQNFMKVEKK